MSTGPASAIDWDRPWLAPLRRIAALLPVDQHWRNAASAIALQRGLVNHQGMPIVFAEQSELPPGMAYESYIGRSGRVPSRDNLHDFFNALVWLTYPLAKASLNAAQAHEIERLALAADPAPAESGQVALPTLLAATNANVRGVLRDRATVFDENAALLVTSETTVEAALRSHDWRQALVMQREAFGTCCEVRLFGHALMEKLVSPYKAITAHVWTMRVEPGFFALDEPEKQRQVDLLSGAAIRNGLLRVPPMHLPVLGVPGWWSVQDDAFYADQMVFRPRRSI